MTVFSPHDRVLVSPRHLAGAGIDHLADATSPLIHLFGWHHAFDRDTGRITVSRPDGGLFVNFNSRHTRGQWWSIAHHEPQWEVRFSRRTPIEAIAAVTQSLPQLHGDPRHTESIPLTTSTPAGIAHTEGWTRTPPGGFTSPDGHCTLAHHPGADTAWTVTHSILDGVDTHWTAIFTQNTPAQLVAQFLTHLTTTTPVDVSTAMLFSPEAASSSPH